MLRFYYKWTIKIDSKPNSEEIDIEFSSLITKTVKKGECYSLPEVSWFPCFVKRLLVHSGEYDQICS